jgi:uncharacterized protein YbjQ (UPF0145 family)
MITTTLDLKQDYEILGPIYFQISNKGFFSSQLSKLSKIYENEIAIKRKEQLMDNQKFDWGFLYGELSYGMQNEFDKAFYISVRELEKKAIKMGADAVIGMRQDIDLDTVNFQYFYLQMYGTAVKFK